jgi:hypothetical protein
MKLKVRNLSEIRGQDAKLYEALTDIVAGVNASNQSTNADPHGQTAPPPTPNGVKVTAKDGIFSAEIQDKNQSLYRGISYFLEYDTSPHFANPQPVHLGPSRNWRGHLGNQTLHWRAYSSYPTSTPSGAVYHGGINPTPVVGGGLSGPAIGVSQGSGTGPAGEGLHGYGKLPFRGNNPPVRG